MGAFVIGAFALGVVALLTFGGVSIFSKPQRFVVYFNESIHGLDLGSPVKLRGVRVGRVADLNIRYDDKTNRSVVTSVMTEEDGKTRLTVTVLYPSLQVRDMVLNTGMARGAAISYDRLEDLVRELQRSSSGLQ